KPHPLKGANPPLPRRVRPGVVCQFPPLPGFTPCPRDTPSIILNMSKKCERSPDIETLSTVAAVCFSGDLPHRRPGGGSGRGGGRRSRLPAGGAGGGQRLHTASGAAGCPG